MPTFTTRDHTTLFYKDWGAGPPVVFSHAWAMSSDMWQYQMNALADEGFRCIAVDRRGHGRSDDPGVGYDYDTLADDLAELIDHLGLADVTLVAHSFAGGEAVRYITRHGADRTARVALIAATLPCLLQGPDNPTGVDAAVFEAVRAQIRQDFGRWIAAGADGYVGRGLPGCDVSDALVDWQIRDMLRASLRAVIQTNEAMVEADFRDELQSARAPDAHRARRPRPLGAGGVDRAPNRGARPGEPFRALRERAARPVLESPRPAHAGPHRLRQELTSQPKCDRKKPSVS